MTQISHIDHIAIVVKSINEVRHFYEQALGLKISHIEEIPKRGIKTAFITIGKTKLELIEPLGEHSEVNSFLQKKGPGIHHIAFNASNIHELSANLQEHQVNLTYEEPQNGAHGSRVNFIHPKSAFGVLFELVEDFDD